MSQLASYPNHAVATVGARTAQGGTVVSGDPRVLMDGHAIACVGDRVTYPDGRDARIQSGSRHVFVAERAIAAVGSRLDNGDVIVESLQSAVALCDSEEYGPALEHDASAIASEEA
ncbi:putative Zn-binding protein involved in type VI secretion [Lysobacter sp. OAE881]|uniref:PAAR domain-containing protein n=1 Tax=Lysobacter sp. OAE881 TaxID=2663813 RepID=UPI001789057C